MDRLQLLLNWKGELFSFQKCRCKLLPILTTKKQTCELSIVSVRL